jgi:hypothetical protein
MKPVFVDARLCPNSPFYRVLAANRVFLCHASYGVDTAKAARSHLPNGQPRASALHRGNSLTAVEAEDAALMTSPAQKVSALDWCSEFDYDSARAPEITLRRVGELRSQPISFHQAYGEPGPDVDIYSPAHCPSERIVGTAQAQARGLEVRHSKQDMPERGHLGVFGEARSRPN